MLRNRVCHKSAHAKTRIAEGLAMRVFRVGYFGLEVQSLQVPGEPVFGRVRPALTCALENDCRAHAFRHANCKIARFAAIAPQFGTRYFNE